MAPISILSTFLPTQFSFLFLFLLLTLVIAPTLACTENVKSCGGSWWVIQCIDGDEKRVTLCQKGEFLESLSVHALF
jgi:hypothetical protein